MTILQEIDKLGWYDFMNRLKLLLKQLANRSSTTTEGEDGLNSSDATLLSRANHTGTQLSNTISDFNTSVDARVAYGVIGKEDTITTGTASQYWRGDKSWQTLDKTAVGLGNVTNTSDANKPISAAAQTALDLKVDKVTGKSLVNDTDITKISTAVQPDTNTVFSNVNSNAIVTLTYTANVLNWTGLESNLLKIILTKDSVLANPSSPITNAVYQFIVEQNSVGLWTMTYGTKFKFPNGTVPVIDLNANSKGILTSIYDGTHFLVTSAQNFL